jgi:hypothetical protein
MSFRIPPPRRWRAAAVVTFVSTLALFVLLFALGAASVSVRAQAPEVASQAATICPGRDLLEGLAPIQARGFDAPARANDGWFAVEGASATGLDVATARTPGARMIWDLGAVYPIAALSIQADNNDPVHVDVSLDRKSWQRLFDAPVVPEPGVRTRHVRDLDAHARYVAVSFLEGDLIFALGEVDVYCSVPEQWPPRVLVHNTIDERPADLRLTQAQSAKVVFGLLAIALLVPLWPRMSARRQRWVALSVVLLSAASWTNFGMLHGERVIHFWDQAHYFLGSKYFDELGYFDLYDCIAQAEREAGRGAGIDLHPHRDLRDNRLYPGWWSQSAGARCDAPFSEARWREFRADLELLRPQFVYHPFEALRRDHGYNATPIHTAWLRLWTSWLSASEANLIALAQLDSLALAIAIVALWWGYGGRIAAAAAVTIAVGYEWGYQWVGGSLGRHTWLACAAVGFAGLRRGRPALGAAGLTLATLLRFIPGVFLGGMGLVVLIQAARRRHLDRFGRRALAAVALTTALGLSAGAVVNGPDSYRQWVRVLERHSSTPLSNQLGLPFLLGYRLDHRPQHVTDARLSDPSANWSALHMLHRMERAPIQIGAVLFGLGMAAALAYRGVPAWYGAAATFPLLFSVLPSTSYDYIWLALLATLGEERPRRLGALMALATGSVVLGLYQPNIDERHFLLGAILAALVMWGAWDVLREVFGTAEQTQVEGQKLAA